MDRVATEALPGRPLHGIRVLDLTRFLPGGLCSYYLARSGAHVIKVEMPGRGDPLRAVEGGKAFDLLCQEVRSLALDLRQPGAADLLRRLALTTDVVVENWGAGSAAELDLSAEAFLRENPQLVYCSLTAYSPSHGHPLESGYDLCVQALAGLLSLNAPAVQPSSLPLADIAGAVEAVHAILAALVARERTGKGGMVMVNMLDSLLPWLTPHIATTLSQGRAPEPGAERLTGGMPGYGTYVCADGKHFVLGAVHEAPWSRLCLSLGQPEWVERRRDRTRWPEVQAQLRNCLLSRTQPDWLAFFEQERVPAVPVLSLPETLNQTWPWASGRTQAPRVGEQTEQILREAGITDIS